MRQLVIFFLLGLAVPSCAQDSVYKYWVELTDKAGCAYTLQQPEAYLSPRALERRMRQRIAIDSLDLPLSGVYLDRLRQAGFTVQNRSKWLNGVTLFAPTDTLADLLDSLPFVKGYRLYERGPRRIPVVKVPRLGMEVEAMPFDTLFSPSYYAYGYDAIAQLNGIALHRSGYRGEGLLVGVCDGGFPGVDSVPYFDSLRAEGRLMATRDFVWDGSNVFNIHMHGTLVLSTMAANIPGLFVGTAPKASYVLCRTESTLSETPLEEYNWVAAAEYLDSLGADIVTTSLGYFFFDDSTMNHTDGDLDGRTVDMSRAADIAVSRGMLVLNAAGNEGDADSPHLNIPADAARVLTVGACNLEGEVCDFSSFGPTADLRVKPDVLAQGYRVSCITAAGLVNQVSGTSLACPLMAGMMACLWQRYPGLTPGQLCDSVRSWGSRADSVDNRGGYGIPDFGHAVGAVRPLSIRVKEEVPFVLFPNPAHDYVRCELDETDVHEAAVSIVDLWGREVLQQPIRAKATVLPLSELPRGMYWVRLFTPRGVSVQKLMLW